MFAGQPERVIELSGAAVEQARGSGDVEALAAALTARHGALLHAEHLRRAAASCPSTWSRSRAGPASASSRAWPSTATSTTWSRTGELDRARAEHAGLAALADELRQPLLQHFATGWAVVWAQMDGRFEDAQQLAGQCFEYGQRAQSRDAPTQLAGQMLSLQRQREGLGDVIEAIEGALAQYPALVAWHAVLPLAHLDAGTARAGARAVRDVRRKRLRDRAARHVLADRDHGAGARPARCSATPSARARSTTCSRPTPSSTCRSAPRAASARRCGSWPRSPARWATGTAMERDFERALELNIAWRNRPVIALTQLEYARLAAQARRARRRRARGRAQRRGDGDGGRARHAGRPPPRSTLDCLNGVGVCAR